MRPPTNPGRFNGRGAGFTMGFGYDVLDRLKTVNGLINRTYDYDDHGNRTAATGYGYTYNPATLRMTSVDAPIEYGGGSLTYDPVGNMTADPSGRTYTYTPLNMMRSATIGAASTWYSYDGDNLRIRRSATTTNEYFVRDPAGRLLSEYRVESGALQWRRNYIYLGDRLLASASTPTEPTVGFDSASTTVAENAGSLTVTVALSTPTPLAAPLTVIYSTADGTATQPTDYLSASGTVTFPAGSTNGATTAIAVPIIDKVWHEPTEAFTVSLSNPVGGLIGTATLEVLITDDDPVQPPPSDFNGDGHPDLVWRNTVSGSNAWWFMNGPSLSTSAQFTVVADQAWEIRAVGDVNGDGHPDLVWQNMTTGQHTAWLYNGTTLLVTLNIDADPSPGATKYTETDLAWKIMAAGDMDQDGVDDLIWQNAPTGQQRIWHMKNLGPAPPVSLEIRDSATISLNSSPNTPWRIAGVGDIDRDGWPDLVWRDYIGGGVATWHMRDQTAVETLAMSLPATDLNWRLVGVGDVARDGVRDGKPDLLWQNDATGYVAIWYMDGRQVSLTIYLTPNVVDPSTNWRMVGVK